MAWAPPSQPPLPRFSCNSPPPPTTAPGPLCDSPAVRGSAGPTCRPPRRPLSALAGPIPAARAGLGPFSPLLNGVRLRAAAPRPPLAPRGWTSSPRKPRAPVGGARAALPERGAGGVGDFQILALSARGGDSCSRAPPPPLPRAPEVWGPGAAGPPAPRKGLRGRLQDGKLRHTELSFFSF